MAPPDGEMTCSQIIETANRVVVVDAQLLRKYAQEVRGYVDRLGKPIDRVILSHPHPDHWLGLEYFQDVPIYALAETTGEIAATGDAFRQYKRESLGDAIADKTVTPTHTVVEGSEQIDGLTYVYRKIVNGESGVSLLIEIPEIKTVIAQDLVYNHIYLCVGVKNQQGEFMFDGWIANLETLQGRDYETVLAGHGEPTTPAIFPELVEYVRQAKVAYETGKGPEYLKATMAEKYPNYRLPDMLDFANVYLYYWKW